jgi:hypothetical protein
MKRPRPYVPFNVRVEVAKRQFVEKYGDAGRIALLTEAANGDAELLRRLLEALHANFAGEKYNLDHDPPLRCRIFNARTGKYKPDANDPRYLVYRTAEDHRVKTNIRGEHGQYPDRVLIKRTRRHESPKKKWRGRWPSRKFPTKRDRATGRGRKMKKTRLFK